MSTPLGPRGVRLCVVHVDGIFLSFYDGYALVALGYRSILKVKPNKGHARCRTYMDRIWLWQHPDHPVLPRRLVPDAHSEGPSLLTTSCSGSRCTFRSSLPRAASVFLMIFFRVGSFGRILESASYSVYASCDFKTVFF